MSRQPTRKASTCCGTWRRSQLLVPALVAFWSVACGGPANDMFGSSAEPLTGSDAVARAQQWVTAQVPYCQSPNGEPDPDPSCSSVCMRTSNPAWDPYRSDCSGFVSWAWELPAPGRTTDEFAPAVTDITEVINGSDLEPGDALNIPADHMILFVSWITPGQSATFMEEPGCSSAIMYAHEFTSNVEINGSSVTVDYEGKAFTAIRYTGLTGQGDAGSVTVPDAGTPCFVSSLGLSGECMLTTDCAAAGGTSTPGYCPGPTDIQCCTGRMMTSPRCASNSECTGSTPICNTATGACQGCSANSDCTHGVCATAANDPLRGRCVECTSNSECPAPGTCDTATDTCVECASDAECPGTKPLCESGTCQGCRLNSDCSGNPSGAVCRTSGANAGECVTCTSGDTAACRGSTPVCDDSAGTCVECLTNSDCKTSAAPTCSTTSHTCGCSPMDTSCSRNSADAGMSRSAPDAGMGRSSPDAGMRTSGALTDAGTSSESGTQAPSGGCATGTSDLALLGLFCGAWQRRRFRVRSRR